MVNLKCLVHGKFEMFETYFLASAGTWVRSLDSTSAAHSSCPTCTSTLTAYNNKQNKTMRTCHSIQFRPQVRMYKKGRFFLSERIMKVKLLSIFVKFLMGLKPIFKSILAYYWLRDKTLSVTG